MFLLPPAPRRTLLCARWLCHGLGLFYRRINMSRVQESSAFPVFGSLCSFGSFQGFTRTARREEERESKRVSRAKHKKTTRIILFFFFPSPGVIRFVPHEQQQAPRLFADIITFFLRKKNKVAVCDWGPPKSRHSRRRHVSVLFAPRAQTNKTTKYTVGSASFQVYQVYIILFWILGCWSSSSSPSSFGATSSREGSFSHHNTGVPYRLPTRFSFLIPKKQNPAKSLHTTSPSRRRRRRRHLDGIYIKVFPSFGWFDSAFFFGWI